MRYAALTLPVFLLGCSSTPAPVQPESVQCAPERTLQDEANGVYVGLDGNNHSRTYLSYGDFSHGFMYEIVHSFGTELQFNLFKNNELERGITRSLRFTDKIPLGTVDYVLICDDMYDDTNLTNKKHCHNLSQTDGEILNRAYQNLITIASQHEQNKRDPALETELMNAYDLIIQNEGY